MSKIFLLLALASLLVAWVNGGVAAPQGINKPALLQALATNRAKWAASGITSYVLRQEVLCFCPTQGEIEITVVNGAIISTSAAPGPNSSTETVEDAFDSVLRAINDQSTGDLEVVYDEQLGYVRSYLVGGFVPVGVANELVGRRFEIVRIIARNSLPVPTLPVPFPVVGGGSLPIGLPGLPLVLGGRGVVPPVNLIG